MTIALIIIRIEWVNLVETFSSNKQKKEKRKENCIYISYTPGTRPESKTKETILADRVILNQVGGTGRRLWTIRYRYILSTAYPPRPKHMNTPASLVARPNPCQDKPVNTILSTSDHQWRAYAPSGQASKQTDQQNKPEETNEKTGRRMDGWMDGSESCTQ